MVQSVAFRFHYFQIIEGSAAGATSSVQPSTPLNNSILMNGTSAGAGTAKFTSTVGDPSLRTDQYLNSPGTVRLVCSNSATVDAKPTTNTGTEVTAPGNLGTNPTLLKGACQGGWTDQETLLLLEALELYRDDWNKVAEHVGSRTQEECILHFLRLPIEDAYLEGADPILNLTALANASHPTPPFSKAANPILATVAFLAAAVDPRVAAAAAQAALTEYAKMRDEVPAGLLLEHKARVEAAVRLGQSVDPSKFGLEEVGGGKSLELGKKTTDIEAVSVCRKSAESAEETDSKESVVEAEPTESILETEPVSDAKPTEVTKVEPMECESEDSVFEAKSEVSIACDTTASASEVTTEKERVREGTEPLDASETEPMKDAAEPMEEAGLEQNVSCVDPPNAANVDETKDTPKSCLPPNPDSMGTAAACALAAAATKARHLASVEEKRIKGLVAQLVETQLKKLDIKLKQIQELEAIMEREYEMIEQMRQQLLQERQLFHMEVIKTMENRARDLVLQQQQQHQRALQLQQQQQALVQQQQQQQQQHPPNYAPPLGPYPVAQSPHHHISGHVSANNPVSTGPLPQTVYPSPSNQSTADPRLVTPSPSPTTLHVSSDNQPAAPLVYPQSGASEHTSPTPTQVVQHHPGDSQATQPAPSLSTETSNDSWSGASYSTASNSHSSAAQLVDQRKDLRIEQVPCTTATFTQSDQPLKSNSRVDLSPTHPLPSTQRESDTSLSFSHITPVDSCAVVEPPTSQDNIQNNAVSDSRPKIDDMADHAIVSPTQLPANASKEDTSKTMTRSDEAAST
ncbi:hypothetical protein P879_09196 [Paragonimus westermani]|uniref:SWI/SNF related-matrix-associated actin-dependent regulator of chromatin subfamily C n=1 Tax=Paragonimus westermani TaxID=34504 RepID=A0A8T0D444_9TREM|nr:hypothetical protein P879_09196 [Paragonimus westermani]